MSNRYRRNRLPACILAAGGLSLLAGASLALEQDVVVSVYQGPCDDGDFTANLATAGRAIEQACARGSHCLVLPEEFLSGCNTLENLRRGARRMNDPQLQAFIRQTVDDHRKWARNCHVGLACQMKMAVARANVVLTDQKDRLGYGEAFIVSPQGEMLARAELFRSELVTARITPAMFRHPYVWADLEEVPEWLRSELADQLRAEQRPAAEGEK